MDTQEWNLRFNLIQHVKPHQILYIYILKSFSFSFIILKPAKNVGFAQEDNESSWAPGMELS